MLTICNRNFPRHVRFINRFGSLTRVDVLEYFPGEMWRAEADQSVVHSQQQQYSQAEQQRQRNHDPDQLRLGRRNSRFVRGGSGAFS